MLSRMTGTTMGAVPRHSVAATYGDPRTMSYQFRLGRFAQLRPVIERIVARKGRARIIDLGGTEYYWRIFGDFLETAAVEIDIVNLTHVPVTSPKLTSVVADATRLDHLDDGCYDLVHSNSVIEHVGGWADMTRMATHVRRLAPAYYLQTPNFWFPYEPHFRMLGFHWLPQQIQYRLLLTCNLGFGGKRSSVADAMRGVQSTSMIDRRQLETLFPDARIECERFLGMTKSLMAIREPAEG